MFSTLETINLCCLIRREKLLRSLRNASKLCRRIANLFAVMSLRKTFRIRKAIYFSKVKHDFYAVYCRFVVMLVFSLEYLFLLGSAVV